MDVLKSVYEVFKPLLEFTDSLSGETYVSLSYLKPVLLLFRTEVMKHSDDETAHKGHKSWTILMISVITTGQTNCLT